MGCIPPITSLPWLFTDFNLRFPTIDQVLQNSLLRLDLFKSEPQIVAKKYIAPIHLGE
jgi:hypothetical protein